MAESLNTPTSEPRPSTPPRNLQAIPNSELSPPDSRGGPRLSQPQTQPPLRGVAPVLTSTQASASSTTAASGMSPTEILNANGKRTYDATAASSAGISVANGATAATATTPTAGGGSGSSSRGQGKFSHPGGYSWDRDEDAPGYGWQNKKAQEEMYRAMALIVDLDDQIKNRYGDVLLDSHVSR